MIKALIGESIKPKGGQLVKQDRQPMVRFVQQVEERKQKSTTSQTQKLLPELRIESKTRTKKSKSESISDKIDTLLKYFKDRNSLLVKKRESDRKKDERSRKQETEEKKENLLGKVGSLVKGVANRALAPVKTIWDNILNAVGQIILAKIAMWSVDNPEGFAAALQTINTITDIVADAIPKVLDIVSGTIEGGYRLANGFGDWVKGGGIGDQAASALQGVGDNLNKLLNAGILVGLLLLDLAMDELGRRDRKPKGRKGKLPSTSGVKPSTLSSKEKLDLKNYLDRNKSTKLIERKYGNTSARIYQNALNQGKSPRAARAAMLRSIRRGQITPQMSRGFGLSGRARYLAGGSAGRVFKGGAARSMNRMALKLLGKQALPAVKNIFGRIPIIGPLIVAATSLMAGEPIGQTLFKTMGAVVGGILGSFIPIPVLGTILGESIGVFLGDVLYILFSGGKGGGIKAAGAKFMTGLRNVLNTGKAVAAWIGAGMSRLLKSWPTVKIPSGPPLFLQTTLGYIFPFLKDNSGKVTKMPNPSLFFKPIQFLKLLKNSFFPPNAQPTKTFDEASLQGMTVESQTPMLPGVSGASADQSSVVTGTVAGGEMDLLERLVLAEAAGEGVTGMALVARSVLNRTGLIQSGQASPGTFLANDKTVTGVIMGRNQYSPVSNGTINKNWGEGSRKKAKEAIALAQNVEKLKKALKAEGVPDGQINVLISSTGFRNYAAGAGQDPSQRVNEVNYKRHTFNTAGNPGMKVSSASISTAPSSASSNVDSTPPNIMSLQPSTTPSLSAAAAPTLSASSPYSQTFGKNALSGQQGVIPLPVPSQTPLPFVPSGGISISQGLSYSSALNIFYKAQLFGFLYKQG